ncbi:MAG: VanZ family protein [Deltaproteobacteria bacterium]|nr:VanZ family protein [Deltaproteobacteria bacterium]
MKQVLRWFVTATYAIFLYHLSSTPWPAPSWIPEGVDKLVHLSLYACLSFFVLWALRLTPLRHRPDVVWVAWCMTFLYGLSDEIHQSFVPGRSASVGDWMADGLGAAIGIGVGVKIIFWLRGERVFQWRS